MVTVTFVDWMSQEPILSVKGTVTIDTMLNFDGDFHGDWHVDVTCKQTLNLNLTALPSLVIFCYMEQFYQNPGTLKLTSSKH